jgi:hypothetical protein
MIRATPAEDRSVKTSEHRKHIPIGVKLHAALLLLGFTEDEISGGLIWDHTPPLGLRFVDPETGQMVPHPNDPRHIQPLRRADNAIKTNGPKACAAGGDIHAIAKAKRLSKGHDEFRARMLAPDKGREAHEPKTKRAWPKRRLQSRSKGQ